ncbi:APC family permease [Saccharothrix deserti]|uniref:APC family permease n=1 Tax=Saccharothrix deserti TaxID=2593674 RepID=UPI00131E0838|nr:amino acid permease [Saccharothrix deserti]
MHYIASVIGVGVLIIPGHAAAEAGPLSLLAWLMLIAYSYPFALIFARLSILYPTSRGITQFIEIAFGKTFARWIQAFLLLTLLVANPVLGLAGARYLLNIWDANPSNLQIVGVGSLFVIGSILFNLLGVKLSTRVQATVLGVLIFFLVVVIAVSMPHAKAENLDPVAPNGWLSLGTALIICFYGFVGWENAAPVAEEVVEPAKTYPKAIFWAVVSVGTLYFAMAVAVVLVLPREAAGGKQITAFATLLQVATGREISQIGNVVALILLILAMNAWVLGTSRVIYSSARDGLLPAGLAKIARRGSVPYGALLFLIPGYGVPVGLLALSGADETMLITASSAAFLLIFLTTFFAARKLLVGKAIRICNIVVIVVTVAVIPFFGTSLIFAIALMVSAFLLVTLRKPKPEELTETEERSSV